ncbi:hypothetical protein OIO90_001491 [Microbotryomycetes sp. JL221]|nr:hypothetical protein OIO90_001491 [Microbotryomycetes sp. JL221]
MAAQQQQSATLPPFPARSLEECNKILTSPGMPYEYTFETIRGRKTRVYKNAPPNVRAVWLNSANVFANKEYLVFEDERYTYKQAAERVNAIVATLYHRFGCRKGDRIAICSRNLPEFCFLFHAAHVLGCVIVCVNAWLSQEAFIHCATVATPRVLVVDQERLKMTLQGLDEIRWAGATSTILALRVPKPPSGVLSFSAEVDNYVKQGGSLKVPMVDIGPEDVATILFTSGTTGLPKGVIGTNRQYISCLINSTYSGARALLRRGENIPAPDPNAPQKVMLLATPLFHAIGCHSSLGVMTAMGGKLVILGKWDTQKAVRLIIDEKITSAGGLPFVATEMVDSLLSEGKHCLETVTYGGSPSAGNLPKRISDKLGKNTHPGNGYGATETSSLATGLIGEDYILRPTSAGLPPPIIEVKIVDDNGRELGRHQVGEVLMKGGSVTNGYLRAPESTAKTFDEDGWYHSGDIGYLDDEGYLYISDRAKDIIIRGGENIASVAVEDVIYKHDGVKELAVVSVPHDKLGEEVAAAVVLKSSHQGKVSADEIKKLVAANLPKHMVPVFVCFRDELERNGVGKIDKRVARTIVRDLYNKQGGDSKAKL